MAVRGNESGMLTQPVEEPVLRADAVLLHASCASTQLKHSAFCRLPRPALQPHSARTQYRTTTTACSGPAIPSMTCWPRSACFHAQAAHGWVDACGARRVTSAVAVVARAQMK